MNQELSNHIESYRSKFFPTMEQAAKREFFLAMMFFKSTGESNNNTFGVFKMVKHEFGRYRYDNIVRRDLARYLYVLCFSDMDIFCKLRNEFFRYLLILYDPDLNNNWDDDTIIQRANTVLLRIDVNRNDLFLDRANF